MFWSIFIQIGVTGAKKWNKKTFKETAVAQKLKDKFVTIRLNAEDANATVTYQGKKYSNVELTRHFGSERFSYPGVSGFKR